MQAFTEHFGDQGEYEVSLEIEDTETQGWVINVNTRYSSSLAALDATGVLTDNNGEDEETVDADVITEIVNWAEEQGY